MLEPHPSAVIDISSWVIKAIINPVLYRQRKVTEILLHAISLVPGFEEGLFLKGGILMALAYNSSRNTGDIDFSATGDPEEIKQKVILLLNNALLSAARTTGHNDIICKVQRVTPRPRPETFAESPFPALEITIGSAARMNVSEEKRLSEGKSLQVVRIDLSFREPIGSVQKLIIGDGKTVQAYGLYDLVAEKLRAILQQIIRPHPGSRRQDVYDISCLIPLIDLDGEEKSNILVILRKKSRERGFEPTKEMITDIRIDEKLRVGWDTLASEIEGKLPIFDICFGKVKEFYQGLPWEKTETPP